jgi:vacuolar-type H+-ATPase subunit H
VAIDTIKKVEEAEKNAGLAIQKAVEEKEHIIGKALKDGENLIHQKRLEIKKEKEELIKNAREDADKEIAKLTDEINAQIKDIESSKGNMDKAVDFIVKSIAG